MYGIQLRDRRIDRPFVVLPAVVEKRHKRSVDKANTMISSDRANFDELCRRTYFAERFHGRQLATLSLFLTIATTKATQSVRRGTIFEEKAAATVEARATYIEETTEEANGYREEGKTKENRGMMRVT